MCAHQHAQASAQKVKVPSPAASQVHLRPPTAPQGAASCWPGPRERAVKAIKRARARACEMERERGWCGRERGRNREEREGGREDGRPRTNLEGASRSRRCISMSDFNTVVCRVYGRVRTCACVCWCAGGRDRQHLSTASWRVCACGGSRVASSLWHQAIGETRRHLTKRVCACVRVCVRAVWLYV